MNFQKKKQINGQRVSMRYPGSKYVSKNLKATPEQYGFITNKKLAIISIGGQKLKMDVA